MIGFFFDGCFLNGWLYFWWSLLKRLLLGWLFFRWLLLQRLLLRWLLLLQRFSSCLNFILVNFKQVSECKYRVKWGYQDNFKPVYFFFCEKIWCAQKAQKCQTSNFNSFGWLMFACNVLLYARNLFVNKKINKQAWNCLDNLISLYCCITSHTPL